MDLDIRKVVNAGEHEAVRRLRDDLRRHEDGVAEADAAVVTSAVSTLHAAFDGDLVVGYVRLSAVDGLDPEDPAHADFEFALFPESAARQAVLEELVVRSDQRGTLLTSRLLAAAYGDFRASGGELLFLACSANMVPLYEVLGCRRYKPGIDAANGFSVPMVMIAGDWTYFEAVKSPLLDEVQQHAPNLTLGDWFELRFPEHGRPASVRVLGRDEFLLEFGKRLNDPSLPLLDDLTDAERKRLFKSAGHRIAQRGEAVMRKGDRDTAMYLVTEGAVEVSEASRGQRRVLTTLGAGQLFGEAAFLMQTPRTADVVAITDTELVVLDVDRFAKLGEDHPAVALKVLRNLCRKLCLRLYAHTGG